MVTDIDGLDDPQRRILAATIGDVRIIDLYVVNGSEVGSEKYEYKLHWLEQVNRFVADEMQKFDKLIVLGDFNIAPEDRDVCTTPLPGTRKSSAARPSARHSRPCLVLVSSIPSECSSRRKTPGVGGTTAWQHSDAIWGLRIDLVLASKALAENCSAAYIDKEPRRQERPSDHAPSIAEFYQV